jgi:hypothetical protein
LLFFAAAKRRKAVIEKATKTEAPSSSATLPVAEDMFTSRDKDITYDADAAAAITLMEDTATSTADSVDIIGGNITIHQQGTYVISGTLINGSIKVSVGKDNKVQLVLDGAHITSTCFAAIYIEEADKVFVTLQGDNSLTSSGEFVQIDDNNVDGALFSKEDLTLNGTGTLTVSSPYGHGIVSKDDIKVTGGTYVVTAEGHCFDANDSVRIADGVFDLTASKDGFHSENTDDASLGYIYIEKGTFKIIVDGDGLDAGSTAQLLGGSYKITTGGGSAYGSTTGTGIWSGYYSADTASAKGIKTTSNLVIYGGTFDINSSDDGLHSNDGLEIDAGTVTISSGDDGIHADGTLLLAGGTVKILKSYEGIEGKNITVSGCTIDVTSSDDGFNAAGGNDSSSYGRPGANSFSSDGSVFINITGGVITVNAAGDGVDSNGALYVSGGTTVVYGPTNNGNGALDYDGTAAITGGIFVALGSSGMALNFGSSSTQGSILLNFSTQAANTTIKLTDSNGNEIVSVIAKKQYQSAVISAPALQKGNTYVLTAGNVSQSVKLTSLIYGSGSGMGGGEGMHPPR